MQGKRNAKGPSDQENNRSASLEAGKYGQIKKDIWKVINVECDVESGHVKARDVGKNEALMSF